MSLRARVVLAMALVAVVVVAGALATVSVVERRLTDQVDERLRQSLPPGGPGFDRIPRFPDGQGRPPGFSTAFVAAVGADGTADVFARATESGAALSPPVLDEVALPGHGTGDEATSTVPARRGGLRYRVLARAVPDRGVVLVIASPLSVVDASVTEVRTIAWVVAGSVLAVLALLSWWIIRLGVNPLKRMASVAVTIADDDLDRRVPDAPEGTEAGDLSRALNNMLGRLHDAFRAREATEVRLRQFVGDASHELRTPVQTIRGYAELYEAGALDGDGGLDDAMRRVHQESIRLSTLVEELLVLARLDQTRPVTSEPVDLAVLVRDAVADARAIQPERSVTLDGDEHAVVRGDEHLLRQVLANVVGNALVHTPVTSSVTVRVTRVDGEVETTVTDAGPGMDPDLAPRAFERFVRADEARTRVHGSTGLGLAIVHDAVEVHGGSVRLTSAPATGTTVVFRLPAAD